jgi:hypothetical protein
MFISCFHVGDIWDTDEILYDVVGTAIKDTLSREAYTVYYRKQVLLCATEQIEK